MRKTISTLLLSAIIVTGAAVGTAPVQGSLWWWPFGGQTSTATVTQPTATPTQTAESTATATADPSPAPTVASQPVAPERSVKTLSSTGKSIRGVSYRIELQQVNLGNKVDGYQVAIYKNGRELTHVSATKSGATRIYATIQKYKPTSQQMLIARLIVLTLL